METFSSFTDEAIAKIHAAQVYKKDEKRPVEKPEKRGILSVFGRKKREKKTEKPRETILEELKNLIVVYENAILRGRVKVGIRPEHVALDTSGAGTFKARTTLVELLGSESIVHLDLFGGDFQVKLPRVLSDVSGKVCGLTFDAEKLCVFDEISGKAID